MSCPAFRRCVAKLCRKQCGVKRIVSRSHGIPYSALNPLLIKVVPPDVDTARIGRIIVRRKDILPPPFIGEIGCVCNCKAGDKIIFQSKSLDKYGQGSVMIDVAILPKTLERVGLSESIKLLALQRVFCENRECIRLTVNVLV